MYVIGITGGVGAGKSEVLKIIKESCNCTIIIADELAKTLEKRGHTCYEKLVELLGDDILDEELQIVPKLMAEKVFFEDGMLQKVDAIVHPAVKEEILDRIEAEQERGEFDFFFIEAALLIEDGYDLICDDLWYIYASKETRSARLRSSRGYSDEKIKSIMDSQLDEETFRRYCSEEINNDGDVIDTRAQIAEIINRYISNIEC